MLLPFGIVALIFAIAALAVWFILNMREASVAIISVFMPLAFAASVWPALGKWVIRAIKLLVAAIISKVFIVGALSLGIGTFAGSTDSASGGGAPGISFSHLVYGATIFAIAAFSPALVMKFFDEIGDAASSLNNGQAGALSKGMGHIGTAANIGGTKSLVDQLKSKGGGAAGGAGDLAGGAAAAAGALTKGAGGSDKPGSGSSGSKGGSTPGGGWTSGGGTKSAGGGTTSAGGSASGGGSGSTLPAGASGGIPMNSEPSDSSGLILPSSANAAPESDAGGGDVGGPEQRVLPQQPNALARAGSQNLAEGIARGRAGAGGAGQRAMGRFQMVAGHMARPATVAWPIVGAARGIGAAASQMNAVKQVATRQSA